MEKPKNAGTVLKRYYDAVQRRDMAKARSYLTRVKHVCAKKAVQSSR
jgi:hypothetical protein